MPNLLSVIIVYLTLTIPRVMLFEAFLSFLGLGVAAARRFVGRAGQRRNAEHHADPASTGGSSSSRAWRSARRCFALNFLGDGLRDALDPAG